MMARILSYATLSCDRRDLSLSNGTRFVNRGVVQVVPVKFRCFGPTCQCEVGRFPLKAWQGDTCLEWKVKHMSSLETSRYFP